jgi:hypothetical protein
MFRKILAGVFAVAVLTVALVAAGPLRKPRPAWRQLKPLDPVQIKLNVSSPGPGTIAIEADFVVTHFAGDRLPHCWPAAFINGPWGGNDEQVAIVWKHEWPELVAPCPQGQPTKIHLPRQLIPMAPGRYRVFMQLREDAPARTMEGELIEPSSAMQSAQEWVNVAAATE